MLKLWERAFTTLTQHVPIDIVTKRDAARLSEVVAKMNVKAGGLNYRPDLGYISS